MKLHHIILSIALLLPTTVHLHAAQAHRYIVNDTKGAVKIYDNNRPSTLTRNTEVKLGDFIEIGANSSVSIKDDETKDVYSCDTKGKKSVRDIILDAKDKSNKKTAIFSGLAKKKPNKSREQRADFGSVDRGSKIVEYNDTLPEANSFGGVMDALYNSLTESASSTSPYIMTVKVSPVDSIVVYQILPNPALVGDTNADAQYHINILKRLPDQNPTFILKDVDEKGLVHSPLLSGSDIRIIDWIPSVYIPGAEYMLIVSDTDFNPEKFGPKIQNKQQWCNHILCQVGEMSPADWASPAWLVPAQIIFK